MSDLSKLPEPLIDTRLSDFSFNYPIPKAVRSFGSALDPKTLEAGDLLLFSSKSDIWPSNRIVGLQSQSFHADHARWHHVAVSGGGIEICEATLLGVKAGDFWGYMNGKYEIKIRRLRNASTAERNKIAYYAATNVGTRYGFFNLPGLAHSLASADPWARTAWFSTGVICSQLYFEACMRVGFLLNNVPADRVCPAHLSSSLLMDDIPAQWIPV